MILNEGLEIANKIISLITSICFFLGIIWASSSFKYKLDTETRTLYVKNCEKVFNALQKVCSSTTACDKAIELLREAKYEAEIYLDKEIFKFIEELFQKIVHLQYLNTENPTNYPKGPQERKELLMDLSDKLRETKNFYRKFIVKESFLQEYIPTYTKFFEEIAKILKTKIERK